MRGTRSPRRLTRLCSLSPSRLPTACPPLSTVTTPPNSRERPNTQETRAWLSKEGPFSPAPSFSVGPSPECPVGC